jgi:putative addiction module component (TIGR02574 family)
MSTLNEKFLQDALSLPIDARTELVDKLLQSLNPKSNPHIDALWEEEIERRIKEVENGDVELLSEEEVFEEVDNWFKKCR